MSRTEQLAERLVGDLQPVAVLPRPIRRAVAAGTGLMAAGASVILLFADRNVLRWRMAESGSLFAVELLASLLTAAAALLAAFQLSIPGASRRWLLLPIGSAVAWLIVSGLGCYRDLLRNGPAGAGVQHGPDCLLFILASSLLVAPPIAWLLSRARPIEPLPVAVAGGLAAAALSAFLLQFFHPFTVTFLDLGVHVLAVLLVIGLLALLRRPMLRPA